MADLRTIYNENYSDMPFQDFAQKFHEKHYSDMPFDQFMAQSMPQQGQVQAQQPINQGDWKELANRVNSAQANTKNGEYGPATPDQMAQNRQEEARRQGELYGATRTPSETFIRKAINQGTLGGSQYLDAYLPSWAGGQSEMLGADAHEFIKSADKTRATANPKAALAGDVVGTAPQLLIPVGQGGLAARLAYNAATNAGIGAVESAINSRGDAAEILKGGALGGIGGAIGGAIGEGIGKVAGKATGLFTQTPEDKAAKIVIGAAREAKITPDMLAKNMDNLGEHGMLIDALGEPGLALARGVNTASPEARGIFRAINDRQQGQNSRIIGALESATGFGNQSVDALKVADRQARQPEINALYEKLIADGADLPQSALQGLQNSPAFKSAYDDAGKSIANRAVAESVLAGNPVSSAAANSEFARLNATKIALDDLAGKARRSGEMGAAGEYSLLSKAVRDTIDRNLPDAANARDLARRGFEASDAFDLGSALAKGRLTSDVISKAEMLSPELKGLQAQGYAAQLAENLNNRRSTPGALNPFDTEFSGQAARAALGDKADDLIKQVNREQEFSRTAAVLGNSKTAEKQYDAARLAAESGILGAVDYKYGTGTGAAGIAAGLGKGGIAKLLAMNSEKRVAQVAPLIAQALMAKALPKRAPSAAQKAVEDNLSRRLPLISALIGANLATQGGGRQ